VALPACALVAAAALAAFGAGALGSSAGAKATIDLDALKIGDHKDSSGPKSGYVWACPTYSGGGAPTGPWIDGSTWSFNDKPTVEGSVDWPQASLSVVRSGSDRTITSNDLPTNHPTGEFPSQPGTEAYQYDFGNQSGVAAQSIEVTVPAKPTKAAQTSCVGGEVGVMSSGVVLNSAFDANGFDAPAHEMQDDCSGHPHDPDFYHYHSLPLCIDSGKAGEHSDRVGWSLDGFPIYGPLGDDGEYMKNNDLDACHGHSHKISFNGKRQKLYHYHATQQFPYTVGCFRGTPTSFHP
jgi:hypothetical protein